MTAIPSAVPAPRTAPDPPQRRRNLAQWRDEDVMALVGAVFGAGGLTWLLCTQLAPFNGAVGVVVVWYALFLALYALAVSIGENRQAVLDRLAAVVVHSLAAILLLALIFVIAYVLIRGATAMVHANFYTKDLSVTGPLQPLSSGGVLHGVVGTLEMISIALVITVPAGLTCAVFLNEFPGPYARFVRTVVEAMTALPSVVAGLFIYSTYILIFHFPRSGMAAGFALSVMMLPIIVRAADVVLRLVPGSLIEASLALGSSRWRTVWRVTLPTARSGLATAVILGTARGIGETSPVLLTAGFTANLNLNPTNGPMVSLPLLAFSLRQIPEAAMVSRAFGAAGLLMVLVLVLFVVARAIGGRGPGVLTPRQRRRRERQSYQDAVRMSEAAQRRAVAQLPPLWPSATPPDHPPFRVVAADPGDGPDSDGPDDLNYDDGGENR